LARNDGFKPLTRKPLRYSLPAKRENPHQNTGGCLDADAMAVDAKGNVYTAEVDNGKRIQKFKLTSDALR
jgi:sugar lactone lactonase YvrE